MGAYGTYTQHPRPNLYDSDVCCFWLIFTLHFVADSKGNKYYKIAPSLRKTGNILLVLDTLILFGMVFQKSQEIRF